MMRKMRMILLLSLSLFTSVDADVAQTLLVRPANDLRDLMSSPMRMSRRNGVKLFLLSGVTIGLIFKLDASIDEEYGREDTFQPLGIPRAMRQVGRMVDKIGTTYFVLGTTGVFLLSGAITDDDGLINIAGLIFEASVFTAGLTFVSKRLIGRARPFADRGPREFHSVNTKTKRENQSMPSGHASSVFAAMTVLSNRYASRWVSVPAYGLAVSVAFQRIDSRSHWMSDVVLGGGLGYWVGKTVGGHPQDVSSTGLHFTPMPVCGGGGAAMRYVF